MDRRTEIMEAITAGERALESLYTAQNKLKSAKNWGMLDLFGGGLISNIMKHNKMEDAASCMEKAKRDLRVFQRELKDVNLPLDMRMDVNVFLSFADFFFDGLVADYMVQTEIENAREQVEDAIILVKNSLNTLKMIA